MTTKEEEAVKAFARELQERLDRGIRIYDAVLFATNYIKGKKA